MAYDLVLAERIRQSLAGTAGVAEKRMFGGLCYMVKGHMCCGVAGRDLVLRVGAARYGEVLRMPHARPMDLTGWPLKGFVYVSPKALATARALKKWIAFAVANVESLPHRIPKRSKRRRKIV